MEKRCIKCGHINPTATGATAEECPQCGVIYAKAQPPIAPVIRPKVVSSKLEKSPTQFVQEMREHSIYPTFRAVINFCYAMGLVLAGLLALGGILGGYKTGSVGAAFGSVLGAIVIVAIARFMKEVSMMLADMSDATVLIAKRNAE